MRVLLCDDNPQLRIELQQILEECGYEVHAFSNFDLAERWLDDHKPDLALLDIVNNPTLWKSDEEGELDTDAGFRLAKIVKIKDSSTPIVFFTAYGEDKEIQKQANKFSPVEIFDKDVEDIEGIKPSVRENIIKKIKKVFDKKLLLESWENYYSKAKSDKIGITGESFRDIEILDNNGKLVKERAAVERIFSIRGDEIIMARSENRNERDFYTIVRGRNTRDTKEMPFDAFIKYISPPKKDDSTSSKNDSKDRMVVWIVKKGDNYFKINWMNPDIENFSFGELKDRLFEGCTEENSLSFKDGIQFFKGIEEISGVNYQETIQVNIENSHIELYKPVPRQYLWLSVYNPERLIETKNILGIKFIEQLEIYFQVQGRKSPFVSVGKGVFVNVNYIEYLDSFEEHGKQGRIIGLRIFDKKGKDYNAYEIEEMSISLAGYQRLQDSIPFLRTEKK